MAALKYWLWLTTAPALSNRAKLLLLEHFSSPEDVYYAQTDELCLVEGITKQQAESLSDKSLARAERVLADCARDGQFIVTMDDAAYPARLRDMYDPPVLLYGKGSMPLFDEEAAVAVVGTRKCTPYGTGTASQLGYELARQGGLELWADSTSKGKGWIKTMQTLEKRLQSPMPAYKKVTKPVVPEQDPWELNDIYAYQFRSEFSKWNGTYGKYALLQKIGTQRITYFNKLGMVVQIFDKYFDTLPTVDDIWKYRILPFDLPNRADIFEDWRTSRGALVKHRPVLMNALMAAHSVRGYPKSSLIYIGNQPGPANYRQDPWTVTWRDFERIFCMQHMRWDGLAYDTVDEGIYEFNPKADPEHFCRHLQKIEQRKQQCKSCLDPGKCWPEFQSK